MTQHKPPRRSDRFLLFLTTILWLPCTLLAEIAARSVINRVQVVDDKVYKNRIRSTAILRWPGNLILRFRSAPVRVLSNTEWITRESELAGAVEHGDGKLELKRLCGSPLSQFLASSRPNEVKRLAAETAIQSLFAFHLQHDQSHGDASTGNAMVHELQDQPMSVTWFDFDVSHDEGTPLVTRRADDLRALLMTMRRQLTPEQFASLIASGPETYPDDAVWQEFQTSMSRPLNHCDIFHLAQLRRAAIAATRQHRSRQTT